MTSSPEESHVKFVLAKDDGPFALPEIGIDMPVKVTYEGGQWRAVSGYDDDHQWEATGDTRTGTILRLLAARIGADLS